MSDLRYENVTFGYGAPIFDRFTLSFAARQWHAVVGPNAAGKTTLLRLATGLTRPREGRVLLGDRDVTAMPARERAQRLAVVPQFETNVFPLTVRNLVAAGRFCRQAGYFAGGPDPQVDAALERCGAAHLAERSVWNLSGGERQRVLIARALAQESEWLLLDEATTFLDLRAEFELLRLLEALRRDGLSILSVTHDLQAAGRANTVTLLAGGKARQGTPSEILTPEGLSAAYGIPFQVEIRNGVFLIGPR